MLLSTLLLGLLLVRTCTADLLTSAGSGYTAFKITNAGQHATNRFWLLDSFGFLAGGSASATLFNLQMTAVTLQTNSTITDVTISANLSDSVISNALKTTYIYLCRESIRNVNYDAEQSSTLLFETYCGLSAPEIEGCPAAISLGDYQVSSVKNLTSNPGLLKFNASIAVADRYDLFLAFCQSNDTSLILTGEYSGELINPGPWITHQLSSEEIPLLYTYIGSTTCWLIINLVWFGHQFSSKELIRTKLHGCMSLIPIFSFISASMNLSAYLVDGITGYTYPLLIFMTSVAMGIAEISTLVSLMLATKGFCIVRLRLSPVEKRTIGGMATFFTFADLYFMSALGGSVVGLIVIGVTLFMHMLWSLRLHIDSLHSYVQTLHARLSNSPYNMQADQRSRTRCFNAKEPQVGAVVKKVNMKEDNISNLCGMDEMWDLIGAYEAKLWMMRMVSRIVSYYALTLIIIKGAIYLTSNNIYAPIITQPFVELLWLIGFSWMAKLFKLRPPQQRIVVPRWVIDKNASAAPSLEFRGSNNADSPNTTTRIPAAATDSSRWDAAWAQRLRRRRAIFLRWIRPSNS